MVAFDLMVNFNKSLNNSLCKKLVENSFYYSPPYLPLYGFMDETQRWPLLCFTVIEWSNIETIRSFKDYLELHYSYMKSTTLIGHLNSFFQNK